MQLSDNSLVAPFVQPKLFRAKAIKLDVISGGQSVDAKKPDFLEATIQKIQRLKPHELIAHAITSHMAPLFGGQIMNRVLSKREDWKDLHTLYQTKKLK